MTTELEFAEVGDRWSSGDEDYKTRSAADGGAEQISSEEHLTDEEFARRMHEEEHHAHMMELAGFGALRSDLGSGPGCRLALYPTPYILYPNHNLSICTYFLPLRQNCPKELSGTVMQ